MSSFTVQTVPIYRTCHCNLLGNSRVVSMFHCTTGVVESGFLEVGVHVTSLEMVEDPQAPKPREPKQLTAPPKRTHKPAQAAAPSTATDAAVFSFEAPALEPTEYAKNRPRRQVASAKAHLGHTTESLDLTTPQNFVGPPGSGAPLSQPFSVTISSEALLVMDFHAHLSGCEIIGLLGGTFDPDAKKLNITAAYPCRRAPGSDSSEFANADR